MEAGRGDELYIIAPFIPHVSNTVVVIRINTLDRSQSTAIPFQGTSPDGQAWELAQMNGLTVKPNGDVLVAGQGFHSLQVVQYAAASDTAEVAGWIWVDDVSSGNAATLSSAEIGATNETAYLIGFPTFFLNSEGPCGQRELSSGVFVWDESVGRGRTSSPCAPLSAGNFQEIHIVPIPESATLLLVAGPVLLLAGYRARAS